MKKIFVVLATRNESDIIESYCRYNLTFCDGMIIYERQSSDNTNEIIRKLIAEGLPIYLYDDPNVVLEPFAEGNVSTAMAYRAVNEYSADLVVPLDTDEFLYHIDGINPRETLEALREDVEYQALWRTYIYEKEPDIKLGFMPNNFTQYRNPVLEDPAKYERHKKVFASSYLLKNSHATFVGGSHFLEYPKEYHNSIKIEILEKLVFAHFPIRSKTQVMMKAIPNWISKWGISNRAPREILDVFQLGVLFNEIRDNGEITTDKIKNFSIDYAMMLDFDIFGKLSLCNREKLEGIKRNLREALTITGKMQTDFCSDKLKLRYTVYNGNSKVFMRAVLTEIDKAVMFLSDESDEKSKLLEKYIPASTSFVYLDTGNGFDPDEVLTVPLFRHENYFEASINLPQNVKNIRFDPVENFACILDNVQVITDIGKIEYTNINGFSIDGINLFDNYDPQIFIDFKGKNISQLKITGNMRHFIIDDISFLSTIKKIFEYYFREKSELECLVIDRNKLLDERNNILSKYPELNLQESTLYIDTGDGYSNDKKTIHSFTGNEVEISCQIPEDTIAIRFDPIEGYGCVISNLEILSFNGIVNYEPVNGYKDENGDLVFINNDPQIEFFGAAHWITIKYHIMLISDFSHYRIFNNFINNSEEREKLEVERDCLIEERDALIIDRDSLVVERNGLVAERSLLMAERDSLVTNQNALVKDRDGLIAERDNLNNELNRLINDRNNLIMERESILSSRSWRITKPLRKFTAFIRRHKILRLFAKGLFSLKRKGIKETIKKILTYKQRKLQIQYSSLENIYSLQKNERISQENMVFPKKIKISIITPLYNTPEKFLKEMIDSVKVQTYRNWELCLADGSDKEYKNIRRICNDFIKNDKRIKYKKLNKNFGISGNSNKAMEMTSGEYIGILDHDDVLHPSALYEVMKAICYEDADFIYTNEATFTNSDYKITVKHYKSDYAVDTLRSCNYICHFSVFSRELMDKAGTFRSEFDGSQDYDLILRYTDIASKIYHIPQLLYFWRSHGNSVALDVGNKSYAITAAKNAILEHLARHGISARIESTKVTASFYKIIYDLTERPLVSIIIPNKDNVHLLQNCLYSIIKKTTYNYYEIIIVENNSVEDSTFVYYEGLKEKSNIHIVYCEGENHNYNKIINYGVQYANGQQLIFLNNDVEIITPEWIEEMLMFSQRNDVGAVGIKLYYSDNTIRHAGIILGIEGIAGYIYYGEPRDAFGYMGKLHIAQNMSAVTASCMMIKKSIFNEVDSFSSEFDSSLNDIDFCLKIRNAGYLIVWTPYVEAYHHKPENYEYNNNFEVQRMLAHEITLFKTKWKKELDLCDPYYNKNLLLENHVYRIKEIKEENFTSSLFFNNYFLQNTDKIIKENDRKIIFVGHDANQQGAQLLALNIIRQLKETFNYDVYLILKSSGNILNEFINFSKDVICLNNLNEQNLEDWIKSINVKNAICNTVVTGDILHLLTKCGVKCISLIHEMENMIRQLSCENNLINILKDAVKIVFPSEFIKKSNEKIVSMPKEKIIYYPQGMYSINQHLAKYDAIRSFIRKKIDIPEDSKVALGVGNGEYRKGFDLFVKCMLEVCKNSNNTYFVWLGNIEEKLLSEAKYILKAGNLENKFIATGWENNQTQYYVAADVFLLPSREDPFPSVVLEAMYAYLPVIAFENGGGYIDIVNEKTGGLVPMENVKVMAKKTLELLENKNLRIKIGKYSHELVEMRFNFLKYVYFLLDISGFEYKKISVIIPNYNYEKYIIERIESILSQTYPVFEIIILDDCSNDNSLQIIEKYMNRFPLRIKIIKNDVNSGNVYKQWSKGLNIIKGDYVWIAEADDLSDKTFLERIVTGMSMDKNIVMGYSQSKTIDESGNLINETCFDWNNEAWNDNVDIWKSDYIVDGKEEIEKRLSVKNTIFNVSAVVFKNDSLSEISRGIENYHLAGDWMFYVNVLKRGGKILYIADSLNIYRRHTNSVTKKLDTQTHFNEVCEIQEYVYSLTKNDEYFNKAIEYREILKEALGINK